MVERGDGIRIPEDRKMDGSRTWLLSSSIAKVREIKREWKISRARSRPKDNPTCVIHVRRFVTFVKILN